MAYKNQTTSILERFFNLIHNQFNYNVKSMRTYNGVEFLSHSCQTLLHNLIILHQRTCPYSRQENGVAERKHKTFVANYPCLLVSFELPKKFWGEALLHATFFINRLPTRLLLWKTSYEMLFGKTPDYGSLKVFGCLCFATNNQPHKDKLEPRAKPCVFLGYQSGFKASKVYDLTTEKIFMSKDIIFHEANFPFLKYGHTLDPCDSTAPFLPIVSYMQDINIAKTTIHDQVTTSTTSLQEEDSSPSSIFLPILLDAAIDT